MRVLITGAGGQVGRQLGEWSAAAGDELFALAHDELDVGDRASVMNAVFAARPTTIYHLAAWTAVDACESDPERAFRVNAMGTRHVAEAARAVGAHLIHLSTDYVFDGTLDRPYSEWDSPNPQSAYGRSKHAAELELTGLTERTIVRISWVCGRYGNNMVKTILRLAAGDAPLAFVDDQRGNPTLVGDLVPVLRHLAVARLPGLFHITNQGSVSWYQFARDVLATAGHDPDRVRAITTAELDPPRPAPRPANSVLDNVALRLSGLPLLPDYRVSLPLLIEEIRAGS